MRSDYLRPENYAKLFAFMQYPNVLACRVSLETGMRIGDVLALTPGDLKGRTIRFVASKTGKPGRAVISKDLADRLRQTAGEEYIWPKLGGKPGHRCRQTVWNDVKRAAAALKSAGLLIGGNITPHSARKTFAVTDAEKNGILHTQAALQHRNKETTKLYVFSEHYLTDLTDDYVIKALVRQVAQLTDKMEDFTKILERLSKNCEENC